MPIQYKSDLIDLLRRSGYTSYRIRKENLLSEGALQSIREKRPISWANLEKLCELLHCQPGDILEYVEDSQEGSAEHGQL